MKKIAQYILPLIFITLLGYKLFSQSKIDSLISVIQKEQSNNKRIEALIEWANMIGFANVDSSLMLYSQAQKLAHEQDKNLEALAIHKQGNIYLGLGNFDEAMKKYQSSIKIREAINDIKGLGATYNNMGIVYSYKGSIDSSLFYYHKSLEYRKKSKDKKSIAGSLDNLGMLLADIGEVDSAMQCYRRSLELYKELGVKSSIANTYNRIGIVLKDKGDISRAMGYYEKSLDFLESLGKKKQQANVLANIALLYNIQEDKDKALEYNHRSLDIFRELKDKRRISYLLHNIGAIYYGKGINEQSQNNTTEADSLYNEALKYYNESLAMKEEIGDKSGIATTLLNLGNIYIEKSSNPSLLDPEKTAFREKAMKYLSQSLAMNKEFDNKRNIAHALTSISMILRMQGKYNQALKNARQAYRISKKLGYLKNIKEAADVLEKTYFEKRSYKMAYKFHKEKIAMRDSLEKEEDYKLMQQKYYQFEYEKQAAADSVAHAKELAIKNLEIEKNQEEMRKQRTILIASILGFLMVSGFSIIVLRMFRQKRRANIQLNRQNIQILEQKKEITLEKQKSDELLLNILPLETAEELKLKGKATTRFYQSVSVLFTDFKGFTKSCAGLTPTQVVEELHMYFKKFDEIISKHHLEKIKTIGDAYMCAGGLPSENSSHPLNVVKAGLEMQQFMEKLKQKRMQQNQVFWELRVGIHTGEIISGVVGKKKFAYDIWGNTVNIASRMETACEPGKVNISEATYKMVKDHFNCDYRGKIKAKNVGAIDMYFVNQ